MVVAKKTIKETPEEEHAVCPMCHGTGTFALWSEIAYFEDRRPCARCEAGCEVDSRIAEIVKRAQLEERLSKG